MSLRDCKDIAETALRIIRILAPLPPQRQMEVMAVAQTMVNIEAQRALAQQRQAPSEAEDE